MEVKFLIYRETQLNLGLLLISKNIITYLNTKHHHKFIHESKKLYFILKLIYFSGIAKTCVLFFSIIILELKKHNTIEMKMKMYYIISSQLDFPCTALYCGTIILL